LHEQLALSFKPKQAKFQRCSAEEAFFKFEVE